jgi:division protein CdvB (Snf7/Vps24/ESCRT-III family)
MSKTLSLSELEKKLAVVNERLQNFDNSVQESVSKASTILGEDLSELTTDEVITRLETYLTTTNQELQTLDGQLQEVLADVE